MSVINYRRDIDGLRAIAVLSVVAFHAGVKWTPGGFVGVDVFFVISGYLISKVISTEIIEGRFSIAKFYVRRAKRILPALFLVLGATLLAGLALLSPLELKNLGKFTLATTLFVSNIVLWRDIGYFDQAAEFKPLLHTWTLSVEEQFYIFWPFLLLIGARWRLRPWVVPAIVAICSFALSCVGAFSSQLASFEILAPRTAQITAATFYMLPARAWELAIGALLATGMAPAVASLRTRNILSSLGLVCIVGSVTLLDVTRAFPGWLAIFPCVGAALLIYAGPEAVINRRLLSLSAMVLVGQISYSLYLWHWPLLSLGRITQGELSALQITVLVALAFVLSLLTWRFVELPFRNARFTVPSRLLVKYGVASVVFCCLGAVTFFAGGFPGRVPEGVRTADLAAIDSNQLRRACLKDPRKEFSPPSADCWIGRDAYKETIAVWGDSHADGFAPGVRDFASKRGYAFLQITAWSCPPLIGVDALSDKHVTRCADQSRSAFAFFRAHPEVTVVVLAGAWPAYKRLVDDANRELSDANTRLVLRTGLERTVADLERAGKKVIVMGDVPDIGVDVPTCIARSGMFMGRSRICDAEASVVAKALGYSNATIAEIAAARGDVCTFLPETVLCDAGRCASAINGTILYYDNQHLSSAGALYLAKHFRFDACVQGASKQSSALSRGGN